MRMMQYNFIIMSYYKSIKKILILNIHLIHIFIAAFHRFIIFFMHMHMCLCVSLIETEMASLTDLHSGRCGVEVEVLRGARGQ